MRYFKILIPIIILLLAIFVEGGCFQKPIFAPNKTTIKGEIISQVINSQDKKVSEQKVADAVIEVINPMTGLTIGRATTDLDGFFSLQVPPGGPYVVQAEKENLRISKITPILRQGESKSIQLIDAESTALALLFQELNKRGQIAENFDIKFYLKNQYFADLTSSIKAALQNNKNPAKNQVVQNYILLVLAQSEINGKLAQEKAASAYYEFIADKKSSFSSLKLHFNDRSAAYALDFSEDSSTSNTNITLTVPYGTDVSNLVATFTTSEGATVTVGGKIQESGVTPNDFSQPVEYVVTAQDGVNKKTYTITVVVAPNTECELITFGFVNPPIMVKVSDEKKPLSIP